MAQVHKVRLPDGRMVRPTEWSSTPLYSTVDIADGQSVPLTAFSYGQSGEVPGSPGPRRSTKADTNFNGDGAILPQNEELLIFSIMVEFFQDATDFTEGDNGFFSGNTDVPPPPFVDYRNMLRLQRDMLMKLRIAETKNYVEHPVGFFPASMGAYHPTMQTGGFQNDSGNNWVAGINGSYSALDNRKLATPHHVQPGEHFSTVFEFPNSPTLLFGQDGDARIRARVYADGYRRRPVT